jgi:hypothetical protein
MIPGGRIDDHRGEVGTGKNAILNFKHSLSLNPADNVRANSEKYLKQLGVM